MVVFVRFILYYYIANILFLMYIILYAFHILVLSLATCHLYNSTLLLSCPKLSIGMPFINFIGAESYSYKPLDWLYTTLHTMVQGNLNVLISLLCRYRLVENVAKSKDMTC